ncbi:Rmf/CrpP family protein [Sphingomonas hominis]|uniref:Rmf/CrpP family protein n=1 Tax=Sphingomonas hominis TaxID=2741495 RepID=UPI003CCDAF79
MLPHVPADAPHANEDRELAVRAAREEGRRAGHDCEASAVDCPYVHNSELQFACRTAWLRGFSKGRGELRHKAPSPQPVAPPVGDPVTLRHVAKMVRSRIGKPAEVSPADQARLATSSAMLDLARDLEDLAKSVDARYGR